MSTRKTFNPRTRAEEIAARIKADEQAKREHEAAIDQAVKAAGRARAEVVEKLYDFFDIEPETTERREKDGTVFRDAAGHPVLVKTDRKEERRTARLLDAFAALVERASLVDDTVDEGDAEDRDDEQPETEQRFGIGRSFGESAA